MEKSLERAKKPSSFGGTSDSYHQGVQKRRQERRRFRLGGKQDSASCICVASRNRGRGRKMPLSDGPRTQTQMKTNGRRRPRAAAPPPPRRRASVTSIMSPPTKSHLRSMRGEAGRGRGIKSKFCVKMRCGSHSKGGSRDGGKTFIAS